MKNIYNLSVEDTVKKYNSNIINGLENSAIGVLQDKFGKNEIKSTKKRTVLQMFLSQFKSFMILILIIAAVVSGYIGLKQGEGLLDVYVILGIVILNAIIGTVQEKKAEASLEALRQLSSPHCKVLRDGSIQTVDAKELVPGDIVYVETGDFVPADLRLFEAVNLKIQESAMTGESLPVGKSAEIINGENVALGDRINMAFSSGVVTYGHGKGVVVATGMDTEIGKIANMLQNTPSTETPMSKRLEQLGKILGIATIFICAVIFGVGLLYGNSWVDMLMTAISLAVAAIPEGLPAISTVVLAIGVRRMVKRNAIIRTLPSVETLGCATVVCSDKTGTLTQNKMTVISLSVTGVEVDDITDKLPLTTNGNLLLKTAVICSDAMLSANDKTIGDPTETALLDAGLNFNLNKNELEKENARVAEIPFDSERKLMTTVNKHDNTFRVNTKGGLDELLSCCKFIQIGDAVLPITKEHVDVILDENQKMAEQALRVLAVGYKDIDSLDDDNYESNLIFIGILGMIDPARPEAKAAVAECITAGIKPVMITGDHKLTAAAIAREIGVLHTGDAVATGADLEKMSDKELYDNIYKYAVFARVAPEHKVRIVDAFQKHGEVVAMTGDGVNDAPALKKADIGAAMGIVGTDVAKDAADMILTDDNFATIVAAVEEGRRIYDNILKSIQFLLSTNVGEIVLLFVTSVLNLGMPLLPIHILWVNLVTDSLPALALSLDPAADNLMQRKPRSTKAGIFTKGMVWRVSYQGLTFGLISLAAFMIGQSQGGDSTGQTMAFVTLILAQLLHVRNLHSNRKSFFRFSLKYNYTLLGAIALSVLLMLAVVCISSLQTVFSFVKLTTAQWWMSIALAIVPLVVVEMMKLLKLNTSKDEL
ncbi:MAG: calcium-translocating P-type ATPase, PMCA-type [Bacteroidales bacterium]|nr:calcium-translocating P-type ATPase, PMCA-type [Bacteroidales bacterium]